VVAIGVKRHFGSLAHTVAFKTVTLFAMNALEKSRQPGWVPNINTFGARLALARQAMGWGNVAEAANACGIPIASWRNWERDGREPRGLLNVAMKIAGVTGIDYRWLAIGPDDGATPTIEMRAESPTLRYHAPLGEHVVTQINPMNALQRDASNIRSMRTRPIGR
jgi:transcriptional regulator with XRE-family HTH domain